MLAALLYRLQCDDNDPCHFAELATGRLCNPKGYTNVGEPLIGEHGVYSALLSSSQVRLLSQIFDECHHCKGEHQYAKVMEIVRDSYKTTTQKNRTQVQIHPHTAAVVRLG